MSLPRTPPRRSRSPSPSDQSQRGKRHKSSRRRRSSPSSVEDRPQSASSSATSIGQFYGLGDENALDNLFASSRKHFQVSHTPMVHRAAMSLHGAFDLTMRYIFKMTSSVEKDGASESERLYQAQNLIHSPLNLPNHPHPPSISQQGQEPSSSPQCA